MGWNTDVVFENAPASAAKSFDNLNQKQTEAPLYAWFESGLEGHADGLPASRRLASAANTNVLFELQPYNTNNVLLLTASKPAGNLTLAKPATYRTLFVLAAAGGGDNAATLQLHFSGDADSEVIIPCPVPDWWTSAEGKLTKTLPSAAWAGAAETGASSMKSTATTPSPFTRSKLISTSWVWTVKPSPASPSKWPTAAAPSESSPSAVKLRKVDRRPIEQLGAEVIRPGVWSGAGDGNHC